MQNYLYLALNIFSFLIPFVYSFERKRIHFIQYWKPFFLSIIIIGVIFIIWDVYFTFLGVWGFEYKYLTGIKILNLPLEEWMFFLLIPYASNFIHYSLLYFFPKPSISKKNTLIISIILFIISTGLAMSHTDKLYTIYSLGSFAFLMLLQIIFQFPYLQRYLLSFIVIYIPFLIVNSFLTGSFTDAPVVFYNNNENLGIRIGTIPIEDSFYCFTLLYSIIILFEKLKKVLIKA